MQCIKSLISHTANVNAEDAEEGRTALMIACDKGYYQIVTELLDNSALVDHKDKKKRTALFYAVANHAQNVDVVQELLSRKADVNFHSIHGISPLHLAVEKGHFRILSLLL
jgi:ankyrin repeat protein